mmetsp:Transcript_43122/g.100503  ORF Transcript_43122/g.100503 Transcript_43122/m.100503 type:complete len:538 (-) Transcript_43122:613-2226(-)
MGLLEARPIWVVQIMPEGVAQQVELKSKAEEHPVLERELGEERVAIPNVCDILHSEWIQRISVYFHLFRLLLRRSLLWLLLCWLLLVCFFSTFFLTSILLLFPFFPVWLFRFLCLLIGLLFLCLLSPLLCHLHLSSSVWILGILMCLFPQIQHSVPLVEFLAEPIGRLEILHSLSHLPLQDPFLQVLFALLLFVPGVHHFVTAFLRCWQREFFIRCRHFLGRQVRDVFPSVPQLLLLVCELDMHLLHGLILRILVHFFGLFLLFALFFLLGLFVLLLLLLLITFGGFSGFSVLRFFALLLFFLPPFPPLFFGLLCYGLCLFSLHFGLGLLLFVLQHRLLDKRFVVRLGLSEHHPHFLREAVAGKPRQRLLPFLSQKVVLDLCNDVVPGQNCCKGFQHLVDAVVVHQRHAKVHLWMVVGGPPKVAARALEAALIRPVQDGSVADFGVTLVAGEELVHPIKGCFIREAHRHEHLVLAIFGRGESLHLAVSLLHLLPGVAFERQRPQRGAAKVHLHRDVAEGDRRKQNLADQGLRQFLRL